MKKKYTTTEKSFLRAPLKVGDRFGDHGVTMIVTRVGEAYRAGKDRLIDVEAVEEHSDSTPSTKKQHRGRGVVPAEERNSISRSVGSFVREQKRLDNGALPRKMKETKPN